MIDYLSHLLVLLSLYAIFSLSLNLLVGYTGLLSLAQAAFASLGAYSFAILSTRAGLSYWFAFALAVVIPSALSYAVSLPARGLRKDFFVLASLAFQIIVVAIAQNLTGLTGGVYGLKGVPKPVVFGHRLFLPRDFAIIAVGIAILTALLCIYLARSPLGRALKTIREDERAASSLGKNTSGLKSTIFALSAGLAGLGGAVYASYTSFLDPWAFDLWQSIFFLNMLLIGGAGNTLGPLSGAAFVLAVPEVLKLSNLPESSAANVRQILFAVAVLAVMLWRPRGIAGEYVHL